MNDDLLLWLCADPDNMVSVPFDSDSILVDPISVSVFQLYVAINLNVCLKLDLVPLYKLFIFE